MTEEDQEAMARREAAAAVVVAGLRADAAYRAAFLARPDVLAHAAEHGYPLDEAWEAHLKLRGVLHEVDAFLVAEADHRGRH